MWTNNTHKWSNLRNSSWFQINALIHYYVFKHFDYNMKLYMDRVKRIWYLSPMRAAKVQASLRIRAVSPEHPLLAHTSSESRGTFRQKARSLAPLNGWACAVKICHDGMLEDTNSLDGAHMFWLINLRCVLPWSSTCNYPNVSRQIALMKDLEEIVIKDLGEIVEPDHSKATV